MIIDCHTHIFPDNIAPKVLEMNEEKLGLKPYGTGTLNGVMSYMDEAGVTSIVVLSVAPLARFVKVTNEWLLSLASPRVILFGTVTPDYEDWNEEIRRLKVGGAKGIKINSLFQDIIPDDPLMYPIYEKLIEEEMFIFFHSGKGEGESKQDSPRSSPKQLRKVHDDLPNLKMIVAHFGGYDMLNEARKYLVGQDVFLDTSYFPTIKDLDPEEVADLIRTHGAEHILYGTDYPWGKQGPSQGWEYSFIQNLPLREKEKEMILGKNALALFNP
jgi:predicted TIM-barrel fold metal-dependent hydrolase